MARGISLHVGINRVSVDAFEDRALLGCENDAAEMRAIAISRGFRPEDARLLPGPQATFENVRAEILRAAALLNPGDVFLFTFAGHGSRIPDVERLLSEEPDRTDEALVLFDRLLLDDYLRRVLWPEFREGVRIVGVADSCHSGTVLFAAPPMTLELSEHRSVITSDAGGFVASVASLRTVERVAYRAAKSPATDSPAELVEEDVVVAEVGLRDRAISAEARRTHREERFKSFYDDLRIPSPAEADPIRADLLSMAACEDGKTTKDGVLHTNGRLHGAFTKSLLEVWNSGAFSGTYAAFRQAIEVRIRETFPDQLPVLKSDDLSAFGEQSPFSI
jgi:hypothetical protein